MDYPLFSEFDMSDRLPVSSEELTWQELMRRRLDWNAYTQDIRLADWENKLGMKEIWAHRQIPTAEVFYRANGDTFDPNDLKSNCLRLLDVKRPFVIKPAHLCGSEGVYISVDGTLQVAESFSPVGNHRRRGSREITLNDAVDDLAEKMLVQCDERESWALRRSIPGVVLEEYLSFDADFRVMTLWGEARGAALGGAHQLWVDAVGRLSGEEKDEYGWLRPLWPKIARLSKEVASGTDMLRVDFLVSRKGEVFVNEMCAFVWPESTTFAPFHGELARRLLHGYRQSRRIALERTFGRIHDRNKFHYKWHNKLTKSDQ